jgi:hypothetical protein
VFINPCRAPPESGLTDKILKPNSYIPAVRAEWRKAEKFYFSSYYPFQKHQPNRWINGMVFALSGMDFELAATIPLVKRRSRGAGARKLSRAEQYFIAPEASCRMS